MRAKKKPAEYKNIAASVLAKPDDDKLSMKNVKAWIKEKCYGQRWSSTERIFPGTKTIFGECLTATKKRNMYKQAKRKHWAYTNY